MKTEIHRQNVTLLARMSALELALDACVEALGATLDLCKLIPQGHSEERVKAETLARAALEAEKKARG